MHACMYVYIYIYIYILVYILMYIFVYGCTDISHICYKDKWIQKREWYIGCLN